MLKGVPGPPPIQSNPDSGKEASEEVGHERNFRGVWIGVGPAGRGSHMSFILF